MLCNPESLSYAVWHIRPSHLVLSLAARMWPIYSCVFQGALKALSYVCMDLVHTSQALLPVSDSKASAFRKIAFSPPFDLPFHYCLQKQSSLM